MYESVFRLSDSLNHMLHLLYWFHSTDSYTTVPLNYFLPYQNPPQADQACLLDLLSCSQLI